MLKTITRNWIAAAVSLLCAGTTEAALIAHYDFSDGELLDNEVGAEYTLRPMNNEGLSFSQVRLNSMEDTAIFPGGSSQAPWVEVSEAGSLNEFTVSFWFRTDSVSQGDMYSLFCSNSGSSRMCVF